MVVCIEQEVILPSADATKRHRNKTCTIGLNQIMFKKYLKHLICKFQNVSGRGSITLKQAGGSGGCASSHLCRNKAPYLLLILLIQPELRHVLVLQRSSVRLQWEKGDEGGEKSFWVIYSERKQTKAGRRGCVVTLLSFILPFSSTFAFPFSEYHTTNSPFA